ncbi:MAG: hypothetical protein E7052_10075 [Lentisphaerae bacterium]|nr:hypothetical protein [Lentisphaerota bacterium]
MKHSGNWEMVDGVFRQTDDSINGCWTFLDKKSFSDCQVKVKFNPSGNAKGVRALVHDYGCFYANERLAGHPDGSYNILYADMHVETYLATPKKYYKDKTDKGKDFYKDVDQK